MTHVTYARDDSYTARFYARVAKRGKSKARVVAASKMLRVIFHLLREGRRWMPWEPGPYPRCVQ